MLLALSVAASLVVLAPLSHVEGADDLLFDRFRDYVDALRVQAGIPGLSAAIAGRGDILWEHASGLQDVDRNVAARPDTPYRIDGLTQIFTATALLQCAEEGRLTLDEPVGQFTRSAAEPAATIRQLLTHTSGPNADLTFAYRTDRLAPLASAVRACTGDSFRETIANLLERVAMFDSVPGADAPLLVPPAEGVPDASEKERYAGVLARLAQPYSLDRRGRPAAVAQASTTLTPGDGLISSARDLARFDVALRKGVLLRDDTLAAAWRPPIGASRTPLPHGMGWFVQSYNGETIAWQFGITENATSSLMITLPSRGMTLILLANSDGLARSYPLAAGDVTVSPFARVFLGIFARS